MANQEKKTDNKATKKKSGEGFFKKISRKLKDVFAELKKVTWPSLPKAIRSTCVVLVVVVIFTVAVTVVNLLFSGVLQTGLNAFLAWIAG